MALDRLLSDDYKAVNFRGLVSTKAGPVRGLEKYAELIRLLTETKGAIKVDCDVRAIEGAQKGRRSGLEFLEFVCRVANR